MRFVKERLVHKLIVVFALVLLTGCATDGPTIRQTSETTGVVVDDVIMLEVPLSVGNTGVAGQSNSTITVQTLHLVSDTTFDEDCSNDVALTPAELPEEVFACEDDQFVELIEPLFFTYVPAM